MRAWLPLLALCCFCHPALSHSRVETYSKLFLHGPIIDISYTAQVNQLVQKLPQLAYGERPLENALADLVVSRFKLISGGVDCNLNQPVSSRRSLNYIRVSWQVACTGASELRLSNQALFAELPDHLHIARVNFADGEILEKLMVKNDSEWDLAQVSEDGTAGGSPFFDYLSLGIRHILRGYDHLAFLLAVILVAAHLKTIVWAITGFTVGHSLTLCLAVLGFATPDNQSVEALIGFTIALVAAETTALRYGYLNQLIFLTGGLLLMLALSGLSLPYFAQGPSPLILLGMALFSVCYLRLSAVQEIRQTLLKPALTLLFGLIHGFGFAGSLLKVGLPTDRLAAALFGFNLGVEIGQLAVITLFLTTLFLILRMQPRISHWFWIDGVSAGLCGLGLFWFISRAYL